MQRPIPSLLQSAVLLSLATSPLLRAQEAATPTVDKSVPPAAAPEKFMDRNGDGIDDAKQEKPKERVGGDRTRRRAAFIDADGDGICDQRTGVIGFRWKHSAGTGKGKGKGK